MQPVLKFSCNAVSSSDPPMASCVQQDHRKTTCLWCSHFSWCHCLLSKLAYPGVVRKREKDVSQSEPNGFITPCLPTNQRPAVGRAAGDTGRTSAWLRVAARSPRLPFFTVMIFFIMLQKIVHYHDINTICDRLCGILVGAS